MAWLYLILGGLFEIGWPLGFKLAANSNNKALFIACSIVSMALSGAFLYMAQRTIPIGTAYAVWTGIGAIGTLGVGVLFFDDPVGFMRLISAMLIVVGIVGLKIF